MLQGYVRQIFQSDHKITRAYGDKANTLSKTFSTERGGLKDTGKRTLEGLQVSKNRGYEPFYSRGIGAARSKLLKWHPYCGGAGPGQLKWHGKNRELRR